MCNLVLRIVVERLIFGNMCIKICGMQSIVGYYSLVEVLAQFAIPERNQLSAAKVNCLHFVMVKLLNHVCSFHCWHLVLDPLAVFQGRQGVICADVHYNRNFPDFINLDLWRRLRLIHFEVRLVSIIILLKFTLFANLTVVNQLSARGAILICLVSLWHLLEFSFGVSWPSLSRINQLLWTVTKSVRQHRTNFRAGIVPVRAKQKVQIHLLQRIIDTIGKL